MRCFILFALCVSLISAGIKRHQNITILGQVFCHGKPMNNIFVELKEKDYFSNDDVLMSTETDRKGEFVVYGEDNEVFNIAPYVVFHHNCTAIPNCNSVTSYDIASEHINTVYNMTVDLGKKEPGDLSKC